MKYLKSKTVPALSLFFAYSPAGQAVDITVDYRYDTNGFFTDGGSNPDAAVARAALEAAAARWSRILSDGNLGAAAIDSTNNGRIGFTHPGTGASFQVSGASDSGSDPIAGSSVADEYRNITWGADSWILYAGGRDITSAGQGGTGTGVNFTSTFTNPNSHLNRGFGGYDAGFGTTNNLPTWGGAITFDSVGTTFRYDGDFYSIALHEIGHALGLASGWGNVEQYVTGNEYSGPDALAAFNADNGTSASSINVVSSGNLHWEDNGSPLDPPSAAQSEIFALGNPDYSGTVGAGTLQDLLMEPTANFLLGGSSPRQRIELTNVDVGAAQDIGWVIIPEPSTAAFIFSAMGLLLRRRSLG